VLFHSDAELSIATATRRTAKEALTQPRPCRPLALLCPIGECESCVSRERIPRRHDLEVRRAQVAALLGAPRCPVLAEDVGDSRDGRRTTRASAWRQRFQRAEHLVQQVGRDVGMDRGRLQSLVAKQHLDHANVDLS
jgi:hypothetical protein